VDDAQLSSNHTELCGIIRFGFQIMSDKSLGLTIRANGGRKARWIPAEKSPMKDRIGKSGVKTDGENAAIEKIASFASATLACDHRPVPLRYTRSAERSRGGMVRDSSCLGAQRLPTSSGSRATRRVNRG
jgi:hypothetical protein